ncbi:hypothetical protein OEZ85_001756 [Tetradesmus obliquus]|uniref:G domain-containing protein n=1 Tax=Tetradesmus obliquus TaxID=3088 RepID=A0ABY8U0T1_TETOB|nr:hypothetical protein OEZ85_001756 [Tetradesmus obliquus]
MSRGWRLLSSGSSSGSLSLAARPLHSSSKAPYKTHRRQLNGVERAAAIGLAALQAQQQGTTPLAAGAAAGPDSSSLSLGPPPAVAQLQLQRPKKKVGALQKVPVISPPDELAASALKRALKVQPAAGLKNEAEKERSRAAKQLDTHMKELSVPLSRYLKAFPPLSALHPFEAALLDLTVGAATYASVLGKADALRKSLQEVGKGFANRASNAANKRAAAAVAEEGSEALAAVFAKGAKAVEDLKKVSRALRSLPYVDPSLPILALVGAPNTNAGVVLTCLLLRMPQVSRALRSLPYVDPSLPTLALVGAPDTIASAVLTCLLLHVPQVSRVLRSLPYVDPSLPTLALVGAPNVGKSSLVRVLSSGVPEVCNYPFTTRSIKMGHFYVDAQRHQITDTPGLLHRPDEYRNKMELLTLAALQHLPSSVVFVADLTEECGTTIVAEDTPYDGIRGLQTLPSTDNGQLLGACFNELLKSYGTGDKMLYDIRVNKTIAPIDVRLDGQFAEQVAAQMTTTQVDEFCAAATDPAMATAVRTMNEARGAAATKARIQWQQEQTSKASPESAVADATAARMRRAGFDDSAMPAGKTVPTQAASKPTNATSGSKDLSQQPHLPAAAPATPAAHTTASNPAATSPPAGSTAAPTGSKTQTAAATSATPKPAATQAEPAAMSTPFVTDATSGLWKPAVADYGSVTGGYAVLMAPLTAARLYANNNGDSRSDTPAVAVAVTTCAALELTNFVVSVVCGLTGTTGVWAGGSFIASGGVWSAPAEIACLLAQSATEAAFKLCNDVVTGTDFVDGNIDAAEVQAAYENGRKALDNHLILWNKANSDTGAIQTGITTSTTTLSTAVSTATTTITTAVSTATTTLQGDISTATTTLQGDISTATTTLQGDISTATTTLQNDITQATNTITRTIDAATTRLVNKIDVSTNNILAQVRSTEAALSRQLAAAQAAIIADTHATVAAAVATLTALNKELTLVLSSQVCDLKTDVALVQRESDYLRRLLLTPETKRPGFNCPLLTASTTPKNKCDVRCPMVKPNACTAVNTTFVVPARQVQPLGFCQ